MIALQWQLIRIMASHLLYSIDFDSHLATHPDFQRHCLKIEKKRIQVNLIQGMDCASVHYGFKKSEMSDENPVFEKIKWWDRQPFKSKIFKII